MLHWLYIMIKYENNLDSAANINIKVLLLGVKGGARLIIVVTWYDVRL